MYLSKKSLIAVTSLGYQHSCLRFFSGKLKTMTSGDSLTNLLEQKLRSSLHPNILELTDVSGGCGSAFTVKIVAELFEGKRLLERQRMVNSAIKDEMPNIHAFSMKCFSPLEWEKQDK